MSTEIFFNAISLSVPKKSFPFIRIRFTVFPFIFMVPSSAISTPGYFFMSSSSIEPSGTRNAAVLNTSVSSAAVTGGTSAVTTAAFSATASVESSILPKSTFFPFATFRLLF